MKYCFLVFLLMLSTGCKKNDVNGEDIEFVDPGQLSYSGLPVAWQQWVYEGDSITDINSGIPDNYPAVLVKLNTGVANVPQINVALAGDDIKTIVGEYAAQVHPHKPVNATDHYIFALMAGVNDARTHATADDIYANLKAEWAMARADGFKVLAFCITPSTCDGCTTVSTKVNRLMISNPGDYDYLIRTDLILPDPYDTALYRDGLHPSTLGSAKIAQTISQVLKLQ